MSDRIACERPENFVIKKKRRKNGNAINEFLP